jgi:hypothetical protein
MHRFFIRAIAPILLLSAPPVWAATLADAKIGFSADRTLVVDGKTYLGKMWTMPGMERHEQDINGIPSDFILRTDTSIASVVLPQLHTVVQFMLPPELRLFADPQLTRHPAGHETINGIATTKYEIDQTVPQGHGAGTLWLSADGIPMRAAGTFTKPNDKVITIRWELSHVHVGAQPAALFEPPPGFAKLPPEAVAPLLGLKLKGIH